MGLLSGLDDITGWAVLQKNSAAIEKAYAAGGSDNNDIAYFKSVAPTLKTPEALLSNYRALTVVATAYGLGSQVDQTAILRKLLTQDPKAPTSLAQQLADNNYRNFANALSNWSPPPFSTAAGINAVVAGYQQNSFETSIGTDNTALQEATYFTRNAGQVTVLSQILADKPLLDVVRVSLGIPDSFGSLEYDQQVAILKPRVDLSQFKTPAGIAGIVSKYLAQDTLNKAASTTSSPLLSLFNNPNNNGNGGGLSIDAKTLNLIL